MDLGLRALMIADLAVDEGLRARLREEAAAIEERGQETEGLTHFKIAPEGCLISEVNLYERAGGARRLIIKGERSSLIVEMSAETVEVNVLEAEHSGGIM